MSVFAFTSNLVESVYLMVRKGYKGYGEGYI